MRVTERAVEQSMFEQIGRYEILELIGEGTLGPEPFGKVMQDDRFRGIIKVIETPKGDDPVATDRRMVGRLRGYK